MSAPILKIDTSFGQKLVPFVRVLPPPPSRSKRTPQRQSAPRVHISSQTPITAALSPQMAPKPKPKNRPLPYPSPRYIPLELTPRPFQELHNESCYLLQSLQRENEKATELLHKISLTEGSPVQPGGAAQSRRRTKNQLRWFRQRLNETTAQERAILARLNQISNEIDIQDRAAQAEQMRQAQLISYQTALHGGLQYIQPNPVSSGYFPQSYPMPYTPWNHVEWSPWYPTYSPNPFWQYSSPPCSSENSLNNYTSSDNSILQAPYNPPSSPDVYQYQRPSLVHRNACTGVPRLRDSISTDSGSLISPPHRRSVSTCVVEEDRLPDNNRRSSTSDACPSTRSLPGSRTTSINSAQMNMLQMNDDLNHPSAKKRHSMPPLPGSLDTWTSLDDGEEEEVNGDTQVDGITKKTVHYARSCKSEM